MRARFSLDGVRVEHRALAPRKPFIVRLPLPPEAGAMFAALPGRGRFATPAYADWQEAAALCLIASPPPRFKGAVWIAISLEEGAAIDDRARPLLALLAREGLIENLARVRELRLCHGPGLGARVEVRPFAFGSAP